jgi:hypothetical protein
MKGAKRNGKFEPQAHNKGRKEREGVDSATTFTLPTRAVI